MPSGDLKNSNGLLGLRVWITGGGLFDDFDQFAADTVPGVEQHGSD